MKVINDTEFNLKVKNMIEENALDETHYEFSPFNELEKTKLKIVWLCENCLFSNF